MEYYTIQKNLGHSPRKLRLVADMIRKMTPERALLTLKFTNRAAAIDLAKAIKTVMANAALSAKGSQGKLEFKKIEINEGLKMKRVRVGTAGRGRNRPYKKRMSHIHIVLTDEIKVAKVVEVKVSKTETKTKSRVEKKGEKK